MPAAIPIIIAAVASGVGAIESSGGGSSSDTKTQQNLLEQQAKQQAEERRKAILSQLPSATSQTSGYLTDTGTLNLAAIQAGLPGGSSSGSGIQALQDFLGQKQGTPGGVQQPPAQEPNFLQQVYGFNGGM